MAVTDVNPIEKRSEGGGLWGKIIGGLAGLGAGIAAIPTFGTSAAAIPVAMGIGGTAGELIGSAVPAKENVSRPVSALQTAVRLDPEAKVAILQEAMKTAVERPDIFSSTPEQIDILGKFDEAKKSLLGMTRMKRGMV